MPWRAGTEQWRIFAGHFLFRDLPKGMIGRLASYSRLTEIKKGDTVFLKGDPGRSVFAVTEGIVEISVASEDGRAIVLNLLGAGEIFGEIALLDGGPRSADAVALTDVKLAVLDRREFRSCLLEQPNAALKLLEVLAHRIRHTSAQVEDLSFSNAAGRLARSILALAEAQVPGGKINVTQEELGKTIGLSR